MASAPLPAVAPIRVLIVDDSIIARAVIARLLAASDRMIVAGAVATTTAALDFLADVSVDAILLDVALPGTDGLTALPHLIAAGRGARVIVVSASAGDGGATAVQALALGAADTLVKPDFGVSLGRFGGQLVQRVERLFPIASAPPPHLPARPHPAVASRPIAATAPAGDAYDVVAIGASTGGIHALGQLLRAVPATCRVPLLVTQHLPAAFMPYFAAQLAVLAGRPCDVATDRMRLRPGRIIVAPGDAHLRCVSLGAGQAGIRLSADPAASGCMPSVDPMFASLAAIYGPRVLAIVLSGMGRDGADGAARIHAAGGAVIVQDQASSVVWGMPGAVASRGHAHAIMAPDAIGRFVAAGAAAMIAPSRHASRAADIAAIAAPPAGAAAGSVAATVLSALLEARTGQQLASYRAWRLDTALRPLLREYRLETLDQLVIQLLDGSDHRVGDRIVDALLNGESSFFRDAAVFAEIAAALADLPGPARRRRIWSAGCATGQEPYSLAMLFAEAAGDAPSAAAAMPEIVATDVSEVALARARTGRFTQFEVQRGLPIRRLMQWFEGDGTEWSARPELTRLVQFRRMNLVADRPPAGVFDMVLCRNVLLYIAPAAKPAVFATLAAALRPGGLLLLGAGETMIGQTGLFRPSLRFRGFYERLAAEGAAA